MASLWRCGWRGYHTAFHVLIAGLTLVFLVMMIYTRIREERHRSRP